MPKLEGGREFVRQEPLYDICRTKSQPDTVRGLQIKLIKLLFGIIVLLLYLCYS